MARRKRKPNNRDREEVMDMLALGRDCPEDYFPEEYGKQLPEDGAWIMLLMSVHVGKMVGDGKVERIEVPHLSIWCALPVQAQTGERFGFKPWKAAIQTPQGEVHVWPHEYAVVKDLSQYLSASEEEGFYTHFLSPSSGGFDAEKLTYIMSRGIRRSDAQRMLLPELKDPFFCYFTFHPAYSEMFGEGYGTPYLTRANHERRAQARSARNTRRVSAPCR